MKFYYYWTFPLCLPTAECPFLYQSVKCTIFSNIHSSLFTRYSSVSLLFANSPLTRFFDFNSRNICWDIRMVREEVVCDVLKTSTCFQKLHSCNKPLSKGIAVNFGYHLPLKEISNRKNIWIQQLLNLCQSG